MISVSSYCMIHTFTGTHTISYCPVKFGIKDSCGLSRAELEINPLRYLHLNPLRYLNPISIRKVKYLRIKFGLRSD